MSEQAPEILVFELLELPVLPGQPERIHIRDDESGGPYGSEDSVQHIVLSYADQEALIFDFDSGEPLTTVEPRRFANFEHRGRIGIRRNP